VVLRRFVKPYQRLSRVKKNESLFRGRLTVAEIEKETAVAIPKQCFPGLTGCEGLDIKKRNGARGNHLHEKSPVIGRLMGG
jgi:hypothetical protein